jgi:hypothetical protein
MRKRFIPLALVLLFSSSAPAQNPQLHWTAEQIGHLRDWLRAAPQEGLVLPTVPGLESAVATGDSARIDQAMTTLALTLARAYLLGCSGTQERAGWRIGENDKAIDLSARLAAALARNDVDGFYAALRPRSAS